MSYEEFLNRVDNILVKKYGVGHRDLPDFLWLDHWQDEFLPEEAVEEYEDSPYSPTF